MRTHLEIEICKTNVKSWDFIFAILKLNIYVIIGSTR